MNDSGLVSHCLELLSPLGRTSSRRMFGGRALYIDDLCMALIFGDALYLKVNDDSRAAFERAGCRPFIYETKDGDHQSLSYYTAPEEAMESPAEMIPWARRALAAAVAARAKAPKKKAAAAEKAPARKVAPKKVAAKKAPASKVVAGKAVAKKAPAKKTVAGKAAAREPAAKKTARP
jgi:DNA transformation protein and related proteins